MSQRAGLRGQVDMRATSNRPTQSAAKRQCPECGRKSALSTVLNPGTASRVCRWCGWEHTTTTVDDAVRVSQA